MGIEEVEIYVTRDGLGRAAIVREAAARYVIYLHWIWDPRAVAAAGLRIEGGRTTWIDDKTSVDKLYEDRLPEPGSYHAIDDAPAKVRELPHFSDATQSIRPLRLA
jgi:hypothetical protein